MAASLVSSDPVQSFYTRSYVYNSLSEHVAHERPSSLVCDYVGSDMEGDACELYQRQYTRSNSDKPAKIKGLWILPAEGKKRGLIVRVFACWEQVCRVRIKKHKAKMSSVEHETYSTCRTICERAGEKVKTREDIRVIAAVDRAGVPCGICLMTMDRANRSGTVEYLVTSPNNIRGVVNTKPAAEGAGTALLESAVVLVAQESRSHDISLQLFAAVSSRPFYDKLHFAASYQDPTINRVLKGANMMLFMRNHAGRASRDLPLVAAPRPALALPSSPASASTSSSSSSSTPSPASALASSSSSALIK